MYTYFDIVYSLKEIYSSSENSKLEKLKKFSIFHSLAKISEYRDRSARCASRPCFRRDTKNRINDRNSAGKGRLIDSERWRIGAYNSKLPMYM